MTLLVKLRFRAPLHIGSSTLSEEDTYDYAPSDTLFSALCHAYLGAFGTRDLEELLGRFDGSPPFLISSAFPYHGDTLFLPLPRIKAPRRAEGEERSAKKLLKETSWIPLESFSALLRGGDLDLPKGLGAKLPTKELLPRVALDRESSGSSIYYVCRSVFPDGGGLWTLLDLKDESLEPRLRKTFHLLGDMGIGGERTMGCGFFEPEFEAVPEGLSNLLGGAGPYITLSRVSPAPEQADRADRYALVESRGWMSSPTGIQRKRKSAWFFAEGSSFTERVSGKLLNVTPADFQEHEIYRYGYGMYVGSA